MLLYSIPLLLLEKYRNHRDLHSFPTRRSSDLSLLADATAEACTACGSGKEGHAGWTTGGSASIRVRSEEHTSELQSHSDLVCRLLLEKKKIIFISIFLVFFLISLFSYV